MPLSSIDVQKRVLYIFFHIIWKTDDYIGWLVSFTIFEPLRKSNVSCMGSGELIIKRFPKQK